MTPRSAVIAISYLNKIAKELTEQTRHIVFCDLSNRRTARVAHPKAAAAHVQRGVGQSEGLTTLPIAERELKDKWWKRTYSRF